MGNPQSNEAKIMSTFGDDFADFERRKRQNCRSWGRHSDFYGPVDLPNWS